MTGPKSRLQGKNLRRTDPTFREVRAAGQLSDLERSRTEVYRPDVVHTGVEATPMPPRGTAARAELEATITRMFGEGASDTLIAQETGYDIGQIGHVRRGLGLGGRRKGFGGGG